jgi:hypothetical protein
MMVTDGRRIHYASIISTAIRADTIVGHTAICISCGSVTDTELQFAIPSYVGLTQGEEETPEADGYLRAWS